MNINEIKEALNKGDVDKIYDLLDPISPTDEEREQLGRIAMEGCRNQPDTAAAIATYTTEEFGRKLYLDLLLTGSIPALEAIVDNEVPGSDTPVEDDFLAIAEKAPTDSWDWAIRKKKDFLTSLLPLEITSLIGEAAAIASEKNPNLFEKLKSADFKWEKADGNETSGNACILAACYSTPDVFLKVINAYNGNLPDCAVAAAENGRTDNLEILRTNGYDLTAYPLDKSNGTLSDIAALHNKQETVKWLELQGVKRDF